jgi:hypothetical protein
VADISKTIMPAGEPDAPAPASPSTSAGILAVFDEAPRPPPLPQR